jgi:hypothetical protein
MDRFDILTPQILERTQMHVFSANAPIRSGAVEGYCSTEDAHPKAAPLLAFQQAQRPLVAPMQLGHDDGGLGEPQSPRRTRPMGLLVRPLNESV